MQLDFNNLPSDPELLRRLVRDIATAIDHRDTEIERLKSIIKKLQRMQFGRSSERTDSDQRRRPVSTTSSRSTWALRLSLSIRTVLNNAPHSTRRPSPEAYDTERCHARHRLRGACNDLRQGDGDGLSVRTISVFHLERQLGSDGASWLDREHASRNRTPLVAAGFGREVTSALERRWQSLVSMGYATRLPDGRIQGPKDLIATLSAPRSLVSAPRWPPRAS
jgi:hypothetical protein